MDSTLTLNSLFLSDFSVYLEVALLSLSFIYIVYELVWDSGSSLVGQGGREFLGPALPIRSANSGVNMSRANGWRSSRASALVRDITVGGHSYRGRSLNKQINNRKIRKVVA